MTPEALIEALHDPDCYPHPTQHIRVVTTHISWIVLTGHVAYKVKKPVRLGFLDFSTLERRHYFCEEELRLNRRYAPSLYLGISRISLQAGGVRIDATEPSSPIEYAVRLRQFAPGDELVELLASGAADVDLLRQFGRSLGRIHADTEPVPSHSGFGSAELTRRTVTDNLDELRGMQLSAADRRVLTRVADQLNPLGATLAPILEHRRANSAVRECHGDLHAGNVVRVDDRLVAFDCLEFDPALRCIDVVSDSAFLFMDLEARGRAGLAYAFLDGWLEITGDYDGLELLHYFAAYRAVVRAKVAAMMAQAARSGTDVPQSPTSSHYLQQATALLDTRTPLLIVMVGLSGSGKSWLSSRLLSSLPAVRIRSDVERKRIAGLDASAASRSRPNEGIYTLAFNERTYAALYAGARKVLQAGESVILDAAFLKRVERDQARALAISLNVPCAFVVCTAPADVLRQRILQRGASKKDASEATVDVLSLQMDAFEPLTEDESTAALVIDTTASDLERDTLAAIARIRRCGRQ